MSFINNFSTTIMGSHYVVNQVLNNSTRRILMNNSYSSRSSQSHRPGPISGSTKNLNHSNDTPVSDDKPVLDDTPVLYDYGKIVEYYNKSCDGNLMEIVRKYIELFPYILLVIVYYKKKKLLIDFPELEKELSRTISELKSGKLNKKSLLKFGIDSSKVRSWLLRAIRDEPVSDIIGIRVKTEIFYRYSVRHIFIQLIDSTTKDKITNQFHLFSSGYGLCIKELYDYIVRQYINDAVYIGFLVTEEGRDITTEIMVSPGKTYEVPTMTTPYKSGFLVFKYREELIKEIKRTYERRLFKVLAQYPDPSIVNKDFCSFRKISVIEELNPKEFINNFWLGKLEVNDNDGVFGKIINLIRRIIKL